MTHHNAFHGYSCGRRPQSQHKIKQNASLMSITMLRLACTLCMLLQLGSAMGATIDVGAGQGGWTLGVKYDPISASVGDDLSFKWTQGVHDVWLLPTNTCDFTQPGAVKVAGTAAGEYTQSLNATGALHFGCSIVGHCEAGMLVTVNVAPAGGATAPPAPAAPAQAQGSCGQPALDPATGLTSVSCLGPAVSLAPGDNTYPDIPLPNPYPTNGTQVALHTVVAQIVDATGRAVPLSEVYLHHVFGGDYRYVPAEGAEIRRSPMRTPLPEPFTIIVNGSAYGGDSARVNFHVINTVGVAPENLKSCIECWCPGTNPPTGSIGCCAKCNTSDTGAAQDYFLQFNVTYGPLPAEPAARAALVPVSPVVIDVHGGVEYSVAPTPDGALQTTEYVMPADYFCPQNTSFAIVKCWAHQHIGGACVRLYDNSTGAQICESCPVYGQQEGVPGDEKGYVVGMSPTVLDPPYQLTPGQVVRTEASYNTDQPYAGVMSMITLLMSNFTVRPECNVDFGAFIPPPSDANLTGNSSALVDAAKAKIAAVPSTCGAISTYFTDVVTPCLPAAGAMLSGLGMGGMGEMGRCCSAIKAGGDLGEKLINGVLTLGGKPECLCPVGELLRFAAQEKVLDTLTSLVGSCTGSKVQDAGDAIWVTLNSLFAPQCPELQKALAGMGAPGAAPAAAPNGKDIIDAASPASGVEPPAETTAAAVVPAAAPAASGAAAGPGLLLALVGLIAAMLGAA